MAFTRIEDMDLEQARWHYRRQLVIRRERVSRGESTAQADQHIAALADRITQLGGKVPDLP